MSNTPKILLISLHSPLGERYGASNRIDMTCQLLRHIANVDRAIISYHAIDDSQKRMLRENHNVVLVDQLRRETISGVRQRLEHEFNARTMRTSGYTVADTTKQTLQQMLANYDLCWVHSPVIANALGRWSWPNTILDIDDIPSGNFKSRLRYGSIISTIKALRSYILARRREAHLAQRFTTLVICSEEDRSVLKSNDNIFVLPNSVLGRRLSRATPANSQRIGFIGNLAHQPNREGLQWFIDKIWPHIVRHNPMAELRVIGNTKGYIKTSDQRIQLLGYLDHLEAELSTWNHTVVPILSGAGTRVKLAEALASGMAIVSTTLGARGYLSDRAAHLLLADEPSLFAQHCCELLDNNELNQSLRRRGVNYFARHLSETVLQKRVADIVRSTIQRDN